MGATKVATASIASKFLGNIAGRVSKPLGKIQQATSTLALGVEVIEELDPKKLVRPLIEGAAVDSLQLGKDLVETTAQGIVGSMIAGVPLASGLPPAIKTFKTLASIKASPRYIGPNGPTVPGTSPELVPTSVKIYPQNGMLEDEIMHRLVLLAENVYQPIADYVAASNLPRLQILDALRSENSRISSHERGEAVDLALAGGDVTDLYNLAIWVRDNVAYDQLILCHSNVAGGQSWLHVSFSPVIRRRQVYTKTFNDEFVDGLHIYGAYTNPAQLAQDRADAAERALVGVDIVQRLASRDSRLSPVGVNTPEHGAGPLSSAVAIPGGGGSAPLPGQTKPAEFAPYIGHPGGTCGLASMPDHDSWGEETPSFLVQVEEAQNEVWSTYGTDPAYFNEDGSVVDERQYCEAVAEVLRSYGFCAEAGGPADEVAVKVTNEWNDQYDLVNGATLQPHLLYAATPRPARF